MSSGLIGLTGPERPVALASLALAVASLFIIMAQECHSKGLPNEDPATLGTLGSPERRRLRDFFFHQSNSGNLLKLKQALNLPTFLDTVVSEKFWSPASWCDERFHSTTLKKENS